MNEIIESIQNGQRKQAVQQLKESSILFSDLIEQLIDENMVDEIAKMFRVAQSNGYIKVG